MLCCSILALLLGQSGLLAGARSQRATGGPSRLFALVRRYRMVLVVLVLLEVASAAVAAPAMLAWDRAGRTVIAGGWPICAFGRLLPGAPR